MDDTKTPVGTTTGNAIPNNGRSRRRAPMEGGAKARYFLPKAGGSPERPELGREMASEAEVLVEAFRTGQIFFTLVAWKAVPEMDGGEPKIVKQVLDRN